jgi:hypothetical protein
MEKSIIVKIEGKEVELKYKTTPIIHDKSYCNSGYYGGVLIAEMTNEHIVNSIHYIEKNVEKIKNGELKDVGNRLRTAKYRKNKEDEIELEKEIENISKLTNTQYLETHYPTYSGLIQEAEKREIL